MFRRAGCSTACKCLHRRSRFLSTSTWGTKGYPSPSLSRPQTAFPTLVVPEESTAPLVNADFLRYLTPLYAHGWEFVVNAPTPRSVMAPNALRRTLHFPTFEDLVAFAWNTRDATDGSVSVFRWLQADVYLQSTEGVTRNQIRLAVEAETEYFKVVGTAFPVRPSRKMYQILSLAQLRVVQGNMAPRETAPKQHPLVPITPVALPPPPPAPAAPSPPLTEADLETYIAPLIANGWVIRPTRSFNRYQEACDVLGSYPSLHRVYHFTKYSAARHFLSKAVAIMPPPVNRSLAGAEVRLGMTWTSGFSYKVSIWSISELPPDAPEQYGISLVDVRYAIELENEIIKKWVGRANTKSIDGRWVPKTMEELWNYKKPRDFFLD
ncbi:hypothetical protein B0H11DRAFT_2072579 [Mycena galericulata]|nr:hypothetical protein B0H11DRAFT_2072579 [Mycena galericulata]